MTLGLLVGFHGTVVLARPGNIVTFGRSRTATFILDPEGANTRLHRECGRFVAVSGRWTVENRGSNLELRVVAGATLTVPPWPQASRHLQPPSVLLPPGEGTVAVTAIRTTYTLTWRKLATAESSDDFDAPTPLDGWATAAEKEVLVIWTRPWWNGDRTVKLTSAQKIAETLTLVGGPVTRSAVEARLDELASRLARYHLLSTAAGGPVRGRALAAWVLDHHIVMPGELTDENGRRCPR